MATSVRGSSRLRAGKHAFLGLMPALLSLPIAGIAHATQWTVHVGGNGLTYSPQFLTIAAGDAVVFVNDGGFHNVAADDGSFRCAEGCDASGGSGDPSAATWTATVTFTAPGTIGYHCEVHGLPGQGMFGSITVMPLPPPPRTDGVSAAPLGGAFVSLLLALVLSVATARVLAKREETR